MSLFSEMLKQLVETYGGNVYRLAKYAEIDRTTIHKAMSGDRLPNEKFMEKLCATLQMTPSEKVRLIENYNIAKLGESKYRLRNQVKSIIELIGTIPIIPNDEASCLSLHSFGEPERKDVQSFSGIYSVSNMIREIIEKEIYKTDTPEICLCIPVHSTFIYDLLYSLYIQFKGKIQIRHIMRIRKMTVNMSGCNHNLEYLSVIAPFALAQGDGYKPYYYYGDDAADSDIIVDTPYRIITSNHAVSLSADLKSAILYSTEEMVDYYKRKFERAESRTTPFFLSLKTHESLLYYMEGLGQYSGAWHCIKPQPCFGLTQEQLETKMIREVPGIYESTKIQMRRIERQSKSNKESICLFCMEGLERFADQGYIDDMPRYLMQPFTKQERLTMLCAFKDAVNSDLITAVAADSSAFKLSKTISISLNIEGLYLAVVDGISRTFRVVRVNEESIKAAFLDFFSSLPGSSLVCPQSDMLQAVNSLIEKLGAMPD